MAATETEAEAVPEGSGDAAAYGDCVLINEVQPESRDVPGVETGRQRRITLLLVDDQPQVLRGLEMRLALETDVVVVGEAADAETALLLAEQLNPDIIIMDVELPGMDGISATQTLTQRWPERAVIVLSLHDDILTQSRARQAGASAFVAKHRMEGPLLTAIREASTQPGL